MHSLRAEVVASTSDQPRLAPVEGTVGSHWLRRGVVVGSPLSLQPQLRDVLSIQVEPLVADTLWVVALLEFSLGGSSVRTVKLDEHGQRVRVGSLKLGYSGLYTTR